MMPLRRRVGDRLVHDTFVILDLELPLYLSLVSSVRAIWLVQGWLKSRFKVLYIPRLLCR